MELGRKLYQSEIDKLIKEMEAAKNAAKIISKENEARKVKGSSKNRKW